MSTRYPSRQSAGRRAGAALALAGAAQSAAAHHSINAAYDGARELEIAGVVVEFQFVNPHPFVVLAVMGEGGEESWRLEMDNRFELVAIGMAADTLEPGDRVSVVGSAGRTDPRSLYVRRLDRPADGLRYQQIGMRPSLTRIP